MDDQPTISTHILDTEHGWPAKGVSVKLFRITAGGERPVGEGVTDEDGRIGRLLEGELGSADYLIEFLIDRAFFRERLVHLPRRRHVPQLPRAVAHCARTR